MPEVVPEVATGVLTVWATAAVKAAGEQEVAATEAGEQAVVARAVVAVVVDVVVVGKVGVALVGEVKVEVEGSVAAMAAETVEAVGGEGMAVAATAAGGLDTVAVAQAVEATAVEAALAVEDEGAAG